MRPERPRRRNGETTGFVSFDGLARPAMGRRGGLDLDVADRRARLAATGQAVAGREAGRLRPRPKNSLTGRKPGISGRKAAFFSRLPPKREGKPYALVSPSPGPGRPGQGGRRPREAAPALMRPPRPGRLAESVEGVGVCFCQAPGFRAWREPWRAPCGVALPPRPARGASGRGGSLARPLPGWQGAPLAP